MRDFRRRDRNENIESVSKNFQIRETKFDYIFAIGKTIALNRNYTHGPAVSFIIFDYTRWLLHFLIYRP